MSDAVHIKNKKAGFEFYLLEKFIAGIQLMGTEIKSIREGKVSINEAYCSFRKNELFIINMHIAVYKFGSYYNHEPKRERKLLLNKRELRKINNQVKEKGVTIVPTFMFINKDGFAKIEIAIAKGKKLYDKRESLKRKDAEREIGSKDF